MSGFSPSWWAARCPRCQAGSGLTCRTLTTGRATDTHTARYKASIEVRRKADLAAPAYTEAEGLHLNPSMDMQ